MAQGTLGFIASDITIPDPTDIVPAKWAAYGIIGGVAGTIVYNNIVNNEKQEDEGKSRNKPKEEGIPDFSEIKANEKGEFVRDEKGRIEKYKTYDKDGKDIKEYSPNAPHGEKDGPRIKEYACAIFRGNIQGAEISSAKG